MSEPLYDEDLVNLGYLKKYVDGIEIEIPEGISRHYGTKPNPPYKAGDTWTDGNIIYTCIKSREIGVYTDSDWVTESGAKQEAQSKNKVYLTQPSNYKIGDMWILQKDSDHVSGKKGEILISIATSSTYNYEHWINMLSYGSIQSINEVANDLNDAMNRIGVVEEAIEDGVIVTFYQDTIPVGIHVGDLWYVTESVENYEKGKMYRYDGTEWKILDDPKIIEAFSAANEARIVADGKIKTFYSEKEPSIDVSSVGDLWLDSANDNKLYRHNGTNWVPVYDTRVDTVVETVDKLETQTAIITTDLGNITQEVNRHTTEIKTTQDKVTGLEETQVLLEETMTANINIKANEVQTSVTDNVTASFLTLLNNGYLTAEQVNALVEGNIEEITTIKNRLEQTITDTEMKIAITTAIEGGVSYFKNTLFTIDENGMWIATSEDEFNAQYNNKGMYLYSYDDMIAKFDAEGATVNKRLKINGELETNNLRIMDVIANKKPRVHIHWIGG